MTKYTTYKTKNYHEVEKIATNISLTANITVLGYLSQKIAASIFNEQKNTDKFEYSYSLTGTRSYEREREVQIDYKYEQERIGFFTKQVKENYTDKKLPEIPQNCTDVFVFSEQSNKNLAEKADLNFVISDKENISKRPSTDHKLVIYDCFINDNEGKNIATSSSLGINGSKHMFFSTEIDDNFIIEAIVNEIRSIITEQINSNIGHDITSKENDFLDLKKGEVLNELREEAEDYFNQNTCSIC